DQRHFIVGGAIASPIMRVGHLFDNIDRVGHVLVACFHRCHSQQSPLVVPSCKSRVTPTSLIPPRRPAPATSKRERTGCWAERPNQMPPTSRKLTLLLSTAKVISF